MRHAGGPGCPKGLIAVWGFPKQLSGELLASLPDEIRRDAGWIFFRWRKKIQKRFGLAGYLLGFRQFAGSSFLFGHPKRKRKKCHRFDAVDADQGAKPPGPRTAGNLLMSPQHLLPGPPCGPGVQVLPRRQECNIRLTNLQRKGTALPQLLSNVSPGLQGKAGSRGERDGLPSIDGGGLGGKAPKSSSTRSKGWRLSWFFFRRRKKNDLPASSRKSSDERRITIRLAAGNLYRKNQKEQKTQGGDLSAQTASCHAHGRAGQPLF